MKKIILSFILFSLAQTIIFQPAFAGYVCPDYFRTGGSLGTINCDFHEAYDKRIEQITATFGAVNGRPIIMNLGGKLIFKHNGEVHEANITPDAYQHIKTFGHVAFAVYLTLAQQNPGNLTLETQAFLKKIQQDLQQAYHDSKALNLSSDAHKVIKKLTLHTQKFISQMLKKNHWNNEELAQYYKATGPLIEESIKFAVISEFRELDFYVSKWIQQLDPQSLSKLGIVVATVHQARAKEISLQYFNKKFGKRQALGAMDEDGLVVLEGKFDEESALRLLAAHYLDREASTVIFNEPERLQKDLMSNAGSEILNGKIPATISH